MISLSKKNFAIPKLCKGWIKVDSLTRNSGCIIESSCKILVFTVCNLHERLLPWQRMSIQTARKVALAYWGFSKKATLLSTKRGSGLMMNSAQLEEEMIIMIFATRPWLYWYRGGRKGRCHRIRCQLTRADIERFFVSWIPAPFPFNFSGACLLA